MDLHAAAVVIDEARLPKAVHEETDARHRRWIQVPMLGADGKYICAIETAGYFGIAAGTRDGNGDNWCRF